MHSDYIILTYLRVVSMNHQGHLWVCWTTKVNISLACHGCLHRLSSYEAGTTITTCDHLLLVTFWIWLCKCLCLRYFLWFTYVCSVISINTLFLSIKTEEQNDNVLFRSRIRMALRLIKISHPNGDLALGYSAK